MRDYYVAVPDYYLWEGERMEDLRRGERWKTWGGEGGGA